MIGFSGAIGMAFGLLYPGGMTTSSSELPHTYSALQTQAEGHYYLKRRPVDVYRGVALALLGVGGLAGFGFPSTWIFLPLGLGVFVLTYWIQYSPVVRVTRRSLEFRPGLAAPRQVIDWGDVESCVRADRELTLTPKPATRLAPIVVCLDVLEGGDDLDRQVFERHLGRSEQEPAC
jgi:hypothetical protein